MPLWALRIATRLGDRAFNAFAAIRLEAALAKSDTVRVRRTILAALHLERRQTYYAALRALEEHGLVHVERRPGRAPVVTLDHNRRTWDEALSYRERFRAGRTRPAEELLRPYTS
jgi:hypothetical protein